MKDINDVIARAKLEIEAWFARQCREPFTDFYWWYVASAPERDGGFLIAADRPANGDYAIAGSLGKNLTKDQNLQRFLDTARRLPILSMQ